MSSSTRHRSLVWSHCLCWGIVKCIPVMRYIWSLILSLPSLIARFMGPTWGPSGAPCWPHEPCYLGYSLQNCFCLRFGVKTHFVIMQHNCIWTSREHYEIVYGSPLCRGFTSHQILSFLVNSFDHWSLSTQFTGSSSSVFFGSPAPFMGRSWC